MITIPDSLSSTDVEKINAMLSLVGNEPTLNQIWSLMDLIWEALACDNSAPESDKLKMYYEHPVWLLNGLFIEQDVDSLQHRRDFAEWICNRKPKRVADFGGGFGTLGRFIAEKCKNAEVHVIEPHPTNYAIKLASSHKNLKFVDSLVGDYDVIVATDVFEHLQDPLSAVEYLSKHIRNNGYLLAANCFYPVIKCHLPSTFHFKYSWKPIMRLLGFSYIEKVVYGEAYKKNKFVAMSKIIRVAENLSRIFYPLLEIMCSTISIFRKTLK